MIPETWPLTMRFSSRTIFHSRKALRVKIFVPNARYTCHAYDVHVSATLITYMFLFTLTNELESERLYTEFSK